MREKKITSFITFVISLLATTFTSFAADLEIKDYTLPSGTAISQASQEINPFAYAEITPRLVVIFIVLTLLIIGVPILEYILGGHLLKKRQCAEDKDAWMLTIFGWGLRAWAVFSIFLKILAVIWFLVCMTLSAECASWVNNAVNDSYDTNKQATVSEKYNQNIGYVELIYPMQTSNQDAAINGFKKALEEKQVDYTLNIQCVNGNTSTFRSVVQSLKADDTGTIVVFATPYSEYVVPKGSYECVIDEQLSIEEASEKGYNLGLQLIADKTN